MKKIILFTILALSIKLIFSQCNGRYEAEIFNSTNTITVNYSDVYTDNEHTMDIYIPDGDTATNRPVILYMHGGSFYGGNKSMTDCVDFCESMAKRGYITASLNYRLANLVSFLSSNATQYETVLKAVADVKAAIRYLRKDFDNGNTYGIDPNTIFVGGYSAGAVLAIHLSHIDAISELPTSPIDVQTIANNVGGSYGLEGDAGNYGYPSSINGVISFAGGINNLDWIDGDDAPLVSIQGTEDLTVNYNCGPGLNNPLILTLCGAGEMHAIANNVGLLNDKLIFDGAGHNWAAYGNNDAKFIQALEFTTAFLFPLLPCNSITNTAEFTQEKELIKIVDPLGRSSNKKTNIPLFYIYSDGSVEYKIIIN